MENLDFRANVAKFLIAAIFANMQTGRQPHRQAGREECRQARLDSR